MLEVGAMPDTLPTDAVDPAPTGLAPAPAQPPADPAPPQPDPTQLGDAGKAALQAERAAKKAAEKRAADAEARLKTIEDAEKTDLQRAQDRAAELEKTLAEEQRQRLRLQVATQHKIGTDDLILLTGSTEEELTAQATRIAALATAQAAASAPPTFAPNPAQQAGNSVTPPAAPSVASGRDMYRKRRPAK